MLISKQEFCHTVTVWGNMRRTATGQARAYMKTVEGKARSTGLGRKMELVLFLRCVWARGHITIISKMRCNDPHGMIVVLQSLERA